jgi:hypothetical protein
MCGGEVVALALLGLPWDRSADTSARTAHSRPRWGGEVVLTLHSLHWGWASDALACAAHKIGGGGAAKLTLLGSHCWRPRAKWEGGGQHVALLAGCWG